MYVGNCADLKLKLIVMDTAKKITQAQFIEYLTSGNSTLTIKSLKTGVHFTYKTIQSECGILNKTPTWYIKLLVGPDNTNNFKDIAILRLEDVPEGKVPTLAPRAGVKKDSKSFVALDFVFWRSLFRDNEHPGIEIWSAGKCRMCGRKLTVPESIENQIGPECATKEYTKYF